MKKALILAVFAITLWLQSNAQTGGVKIIDLMVIPVVTNTNPTPVDSVELAVTFKIQNVPAGGKAVVQLGTAQNSGNVKLVYAPFLFEGGKWYITYQNQKNEVKNFTSKINIKLSPLQYNNLQWTTLFIAGQGGQLTPPLFFQK